jgi:hypothetical protein
MVPKMRKIGLPMMRVSMLKGRGIGLVLVNMLSRLTKGSILNTMVVVTIERMKSSISYPAMPVPESAMPLLPSRTNKPPSTT